MKLKPVNHTIVVLQFDYVVGDMEVNAAKMAAAYRQAVKDGATLVVAPELALCGYPPKDNLLRKAFIMACRDAAVQLAAQIGDVPLAFGTPWPADEPGDYGQKAYNSYVVAQQGEIVFRTDKQYLAQGGVFDEWRVHKPGAPKVFVCKGIKIGFPICEDIWHDTVVDTLVAEGVDVFIVPNGSPGYIGKPAIRHELVRRHVERTGIPMLYFNHVGGQDEHGFEGGAFFVNAGDARATVFAPYWSEASALVKLVGLNGALRFGLPDTSVLYADPNDRDYALDAIVMIARDYLLKTMGRTKVVIGISGGVDSAVVLGLAVMMMRSAGLDPAAHIIAVSLPSKHNGAQTRGFAQQVCDNFGVPLHWWSIEEACALFNVQFEAVFGDELKLAGNAAYENAQSRMRGMVLMAIANRYHAMVLSTGNKSEMLMGYATLYGDMNGGYNPLKTLYKMEVYELAHTINTRFGCEMVPSPLIHQKPSAELDDGQLDENSLPPYPVLDPLLRLFFDENMDVADIMAQGKVARYNVVFVPDDQIPATTRSELALRKPMHRFWTTSYARYDEASPMVYYITQDCVMAVATLALGMRHKRYQAPPGATVTKASLDDGENYPIANQTNWLVHRTSTAMPLAV